MTTPDDLEHRWIQAGPIRLHVVLAGPQTGTPVFLLHGFPDAWFGWRHQIDALAEAGYRVVAPDQRGYTTSAKPHGPRRYALDALTADVAALADALAIDRFHLVGHDWGGIVAWAMGALMPERLERLVILNAPHPEALFPYALRHPSQFLRSLYAAFFQFPALPEAALRARDFALMERALVASARPGTFGAVDLAAYREAWRHPGALTAMLNWYRALRFRPRLEQRIAVPTLVLWGLKDTALEAGLAERSLSYCDNGRLVTFPEATHWLQREEAGAVNVELLAFLGADRP
jgi:pimeloyl-ACP methyl ester carboxylesterase